MLTLVPSKDTRTIAVEVNGKVKKEDMEKLDKVIQEKFAEDGEFNVYAVIYDFDGASFKAAAEEVKIDVKRWSQYAKMVVVSDSKGLKGLTDASGYLPSVKTKHFPLNEMEEAWEWIKA
ncbi:STAS/SEC14 domain-containing protein [Planomicrobium sp. CPCC 101079]|uniref:STAS/SEC14 domain-containing protein n=1 Tax=Planomicrobium sp. CPCC 101079 TaxID=2599618 RepID=UPI0011B85165|nr:STAS/SEC14 domain-containing protein [Planomicrobium sp. CPCC 101079]TWT02504.1 STAS/SEC14 domain-containing protein [Planomicrobium sp. CPCC 101079]